MILQAASLGRSRLSSHVSTDTHTQENAGKNHDGATKAALYNVLDRSLSLEKKTASEIRERWDDLLARKYSEMVTRP